jgi:hypothetical protein
MNYVDSDIINKKVPNTTYQGGISGATGPWGTSSGISSSYSTTSSSSKYPLTMSAMLKYAKSVEEIDFFLPLEDYIDLISSCGHFTAGARDQRERPFFFYYGLRFTGLSREESDKYKILK